MSVEIHCDLSDGKCVNIMHGRKKYVSVTVKTGEITDDTGRRSGLFQGLIKREAISCIGKIKILMASGQHNAWEWDLLMGSG